LKQINTVTEYILPDPS